MYISKTPTVAWYAIIVAKCSNISGWAIISPEMTIRQQQAFTLCAHHILWLKDNMVDGEC